MKHAIFSDIHGNIHALEAALSDARVHNADSYLFLGDYTYGYPWGNDVAATIRELESASIIRGNGEGYLINLRRESQSEWISEQFKPIYWAYRALSNENLDYLTNLPETIEISDDGERVRLAHSSDIFYRAEKIELFHSSLIRTNMPVTFTHQEYLDAARNAVMSRSDVLADITKLPAGVYLFGHNHMQFHMEHEGRLFINPGSCGEALDRNATAAYTLLERVGGRWEITERRVEYDLSGAADGLVTSGYAAYAPVWSDIMKAELMTGRDYFGPFVRHVIETGRQLGNTEYPVCNAVWDAAVKSWDINKL